jgi:hypothetical protein
MAPVDLYLMSPPHPEWALRARANFRSQKAEPVDPRLARQEWLALARAIEALGGTSRCLVSHARVDAERLTVPQAHRLSTIARAIEEG